MKKIFKDNKARIGRRELYSLIFALCSLFFIYFLFFPKTSGIAGLFIYKQCIYLFGKIAYFLPAILIFFTIKFFKKDEKSLWLIISAGILYIIFMCTFFGMLSDMFIRDDLGGVIGRMSSYFFILLVGKAGTYIISLLGICVSLIILLDVSVKTFTFQIKDSLIQGFDWLKAVSVKIKDALPLGKKESVVHTRNKENKLKKIRIKQPKKEPNIVRVFHADKEQKKDDNIQSKNPDLPIQRPKIVSPHDTGEDTIEQEYILPYPELLNKPDPLSSEVSLDILKQNAVVLENTLKNFAVDARVSNIHPGPVITRYELELAPGVKVNTITSLSNDISLAMKAASVRILAPIPGKSAVGIEIPNPKAASVTFREIVEAQSFAESKYKLPVALGKTVSGSICISDITAMPHLLVAGATGSGKSVCINALIMSILYKAKPDEVKFILVDPKMVELSYYQDMPHLYSPVITNPREASKTLQSIVALMERRYKKFAEEGVRNIESYNKKMERLNAEKEFYLVVIIDELADLMLVASRDVEESIARLTQKARAVGIHVVLATQRPSVDVITGVIKANLPSRISFQVLSKADSRVVLDANGADELLGRGDMLFLNNGAPKSIRIQGAYLSEEEIQKVLAFIKSQGLPDYAVYKENLMQKTFEDDHQDKKRQEQFLKALELVVERKKISYDLLRANGFSGPKASNILSLMEMKGLIAKPGSSNRWEIYFDAILEYQQDYVDNQ
ncbi:DNA translocase FtsK 4TM domain-containing protein [bacterium]